MTPSVTVRFWAGARSAAGTPEQVVAAETLAEALDAVRQGRDAHFARVLAVCSYVVGEQPVGRRAPEQVTLAAGDVVEVLPPFAGGSAGGVTAPGDGAPKAATAASGAVAPAAGLLPAVSGALAGVALAVAAAVGEPAVLLVAAVLQLGLIAGWHRALGVSAAWGGILVGAILATAADITVMVVDTESLAPLPAVVGATFLLAAVQQLARWDDRHGLVASMGATVALGVWVTALAAWPLLLRSPNGADWAAAAALAAGAASLARLIPRPTAAAATVVALGLGVGSGTAAALGVPVSGGAVVGAAAAMPVLVLHLVEHQDSRLAPRFWYVAAAWPFALAAPLAYLAARVVG